MIEITHDWDEEDYAATMEAAYDAYRKACYGDTDLPPEQIRETKQAFLSGIHWLNTRDNYDPTDIERGLRQILSKDNPFIRRNQA